MNTRTNTVCWFFAALVLAMPVFAASDARDFEANVPDPPDDFVATVPVNNGAVVALADGRIMMIGGKQVIYSQDGGRTWSGASRVFVNGKELTAGGVISFIRLKSGALGMVYNSSAPAVDARRGQDLYFRRSTDEGHTWSEGSALIPPGLTWETSSRLHDTLVQLEDGRLVIPVYRGFPTRYREFEGAAAFGTFRGLPFKTETHGHLPELEFSFVYYSDDEGQTWKIARHRARDALIWKDNVAGFWSCSEPNVAQLKDGRLVMFMRNILGRIYATTSQDEDGAITWRLPVPTELASSLSPCRLRRIPSTGDLLCIWNQVSGDEIRRGYRRGRLSLAISTDDGKTWKNFKSLYTSGGLEERSHVLPEKEIGMVRAAKQVGELPEDFGIAHYSNAHFIKDHVFITYSLHDGLQVKEGKVKDAPWQRKLLIRPVDWLYAK